MNSQTLSPDRIQQLSDAWRRVVDPNGIGMAEALASELAAYTGEPVKTVLSKMETGTEEFKRHWEASRIDVSNREAITDFYRNQFVEAYELADWHCGHSTGQPPLSYAHAAIFAKERGLKQALDFGSGIGTGSICLASAGCETHSADIARELLTFVGWRMQRRGFASRLIDVGAGELPLKGYYDLITCFDVLEHIPDQLGKLRELQSYLRVGGYLLVNLFVETPDPDRPMHVSFAGDRLALIRKTGMVPHWPGYFTNIQALRRSRTGRARNYLASWVDWWQKS